MIQDILIYLDQAKVQKLGQLFKNYSKIDIKDVQEKDFTSPLE